MSQVGFFGVPGKISTGKVHVVENGKAICGAKFHKKAEFQFCSNHVILDSLECEHCKRVWAKRKGGK